VIALRSRPYRRLSKRYVEAEPTLSG
jgi:hypothetical protein